MKTQKMSKVKRTWKIGIWISVVSWFTSWIILVIKLDFWTLMGFILYGLGLSGLIIWIFVPKVILLMREKLILLMREKRK